jgi:8-oxo-dGTP diphosphatase
LAAIGNVAMEKLRRNRYPVDAPGYPQQSAEPAVMTERRTIAAVSVALVRGETVLLVKRALEPSRGLYAFPGGRVEAGETSEEAARRELLEETGMVAAALSPLREYLIDTRVDGEEITYRLEVFTGQAASGEPACASDAEEACFYSLAEMEKLPLTDSILDVSRELIGDK